jgi:hypothetical protein
MLLFPFRIAYLLIFISLVMEVGCISLMERWLLLILRWITCLWKGRKKKKGLCEWENIACECYLFVFIFIFFFSILNSVGSGYTRYSGVFQNSVDEFYIDSTNFSSCNQTGNGIIGNGGKDIMMHRCFFTNIFSLGGRPAGISCVGNLVLVCVYLCCVLFFFFFVCVSFFSDWLCVWVSGMHWEESFVVGGWVDRVSWMCVSFV